MARWRTSRCMQIQCLRTCLYRVGAPAIIHLPDDGSCRWQQPELCLLGHTSQLLRIYANLDQYCCQVDSVCDPIPVSYLGPYYMAGHADALHVARITYCLTLVFALNGISLFLNAMSDMCISNVTRSNEHNSNLRQHH